MAFRWVQRVRGLLPGAKGASADGESSDVDEPARADPDEPTQPTTSWWELVQQLVLAGIPLAMLVVGLLLTACSELIGLWALLGFALLVASPVVYWLYRIERRLAKLIEARERSKEKPR